MWPAFPSPTPVRAALLGWLLLALSSCAALRPPADDTDLRLQAASAAFGGRYQYLVVGSAGTLAEGVLAAARPLAGPDRLARALARRLEAGAERALRMLVTGFDAEHTARVLLDALRLQGERRLPHLEVLFLGEPRDRERLRRAVEARGARFRFAAYRG